MNEIKNHKKTDIMQSNRIITARQYLTSKEKKLLIQVILNMSCYRDIFKCEFDARELSIFMGVDGNNWKRDILKILKGFQTKQCFMEEEDGSWSNYVFCTTSKFDKTSNKVILELNRNLKNDLVGLQDGYFTKYKLGDIFSLTGTYSVRVYELLTEGRKHDGLNWEAQFTLEEIRELLLGINSKKYSRTFDFLKNVIDPSIKEINKKTTYQISYKQNMKGKTIIGFSFHMKWGFLPKE